MINYFKGGWHQKDSVIQETKIWKNNVSFQKSKEMFS